MNAPYHEGLQCHVSKIRYDFETGVGVLIMPEYNCTDMRGAINLFTAIDPLARRIETYVGGDEGHCKYRDTFYVRTRGHDWEAFRGDKP